MTIECHNVSCRVKEVFNKWTQEEVKNILHCSKEYSLFPKNIFFFFGGNPNRRTILIVYNSNKIY